MKQFLILIAQAHKVSLSGGFQKTLRDGFHRPVVFIV